jgi:hypothetical protein
VEDGKWGSSSGLREHCICINEQAPRIEPQKGLPKNLEVFSFPRPVASDGAFSSRTLIYSAASSPPRSLRFNLIDAAFNKELEESGDPFLFQL